jgi:hypothetical protein
MTEKAEAPTKGLIIDEPWISEILDGRKTWEMRKSGTKLRGPIALIKKGTGHVVGVARLVDSLPALNAASYPAHENKHRIPSARQAKALSDGWSTPWVIEEAIRLARPVPYAHPSGAVIWVNLAPDVTAAVARQLS